MKRVLVTGATGFLGFHLVQRNLEAGHHVAGRVPPVRPDASQLALFIPELHPVLEALKTLDPDVYDLIGFEAERQARKIIMIPSESQAPEAVREALGSVFQNIYAEGYPNPDTHGLSQSEILDYEVQLARYRRFGDDRYYKGVEYADVVEALARQRAAEAFAANGVAPADIWANVQPLSGSPANSAIYAALVPVGATVVRVELRKGRS